ncbi:putative permease, DMT superfamily [Cesiribacter andamanensis AMV16]|uniref:Putative permease, DMT superfamily n=1 Tax=Cesiribacter andamanensis AMV16 TaxID=1279009 RepID=M7N7U4_9BACT|nr:DMT family transporter [Cesiribacter andamanensis]EMR03271.1 putative permease, DMT superfamily [Cesiribacter andamanensis AMV16]
MTRKLAYLSILAAAVLWGIIGLFITRLYALGFSPTQVVALRLLTAAFLLAGYTLWHNRQLFRIRLSDLRYFIGTGLFSVVLFNWCMFTAIRETSISVATILLYTAPAFVTVLSRLLFGEPLTGRKLLALLATLLGCALVVGFLPWGGGQLSGYGILLGLGSGLFYALYSIFGKWALQRHQPLTVTVYTFVLAALAITPFSGLDSAAPPAAGCHCLLADPGPGLSIHHAGLFTLHPRAAGGGIEPGGYPGHPGAGGSGPYKHSAFWRNPQQLAVCRHWAGAGGCAAGTEAGTSAQGGAHCRYCL